MLVEKKEAYAIKPPAADLLKDFPFHQSVASTEDGAWERFLGVSLKREGYENDGFKAVKVKITIEEI